MKIPHSVREAYTRQLEKYENLRIEVDKLLRSQKEERWHYESRLKTEESYALKLESGRFEADQMEDFFACELVVENQTRISIAEHFVLRHFDPAYRKPQSDGFTHKASNAFPFDDLRLYVRYKDHPTVKPSGLAGLVFEVQIKTFLQHAWWIATHDLTYKSDDISWAKERIAFQIKAMLEHAEVSIGNAESLATTRDLAKDNKVAQKLSEALKLFKELWLPESLPENLVGLAKNTVVLSDELGISLEELKAMVEQENLVGRGALTLNLSPYCILIQTIINQNSQKLRAFLTGRQKKLKILLPKEIELPPELEPLLDERVIRVL